MGQAIPFALRSMIDMECLDLIFTEYNIVGTKEREFLTTQLKALLKKRLKPVKQPRFADVVPIATLKRTPGNGKNTHRRRRPTHP